MMQQRKNVMISIWLGVSLLTILSACSTKKSTFFTRAYHNTTTRYNWYFNSKESVKSVAKKLEDKHQEDYNQLIPIYPLGGPQDAQSVSPQLDKAIKKSAKAISNHSILIKGEEHNRWIDDSYLVIAKAYFYQREYVKAIEAFRHISRQFKGTEIDYEASLWTCRAYIDKGDYTSADLMLSNLLTDDSFPEKFQKDLSLVYAHYHIHKADFISAIEELEQAIEQTRKKKEKTRYLFLLAQLYHQEEDYAKATHYYEQVLKKSPDYEMAFNAKINRARAFDVASGDIEQVRLELEKMLKDDKNVDYLDVIYFGLAELNVRQEKVKEAIPLYRLSVAKSLSNDAQKSLSSLTVGGHYYDQQNYRQAQLYYDTAVAYMSEEHPQYKQAFAKRETLTDLITNLDVIDVQDSLQRIALMPVQERMAFIDQLIAKVLEEERLEREREARMRAESNFLNGDNNNRLNRMNNQSRGGIWYFYNPTTLSFGFAEFNRKWGKRKLEDNWRRSNKTSLSVEEIGEDTIQEEVFDPKSKESYLKGLPLTMEAKQASNKQIIEAYYNAGVIYNEGLNDLPRSVEMFEALDKRFPKNTNRVMVLYYLYRLHDQLGKSKRAGKYKQLLISEYPDSEYAKIVSDPAYLAQALAAKSSVELKYEQAHQEYLKGEYAKTITLCQEAKQHHPANLLLPHFDFLEVMATGFQLERKEFVMRLNKLAEQHQGHEVAASAKEIANYLASQGIVELPKDSQKETEKEEEAKNEFGYTYEEEASHYFIILFQEFDIDLNSAKILFSDYHANYYSLEKLNISSILMDENTHMISIREFENSTEAMKYYKAFLTSDTRAPFGQDYTAFVMAAPNFPKFFRNKDISGYKKYFQQHYLSPQ
jgi:tetratricopeptide (TPR) repeat protein